MANKLELSEIRDQLIRLEETIIFALIERAQFPSNPLTYLPGAITDKFECSFLDFFIRETEKLHALMRRYTCEEEMPFTERDDLPDPVLKRGHGEAVLKANTLNFNQKVKDIYIHKIIPLICKQGNSDYGSSATCDITALQAISKRVHYGKFVVESKFQKDPEGYTKLIKAKDGPGIMEKLTDQAVEARLLERVRLKASTYGQDPSVVGKPNYKVDPEVPVKIYKDFLIPLTKEIELEYVLRRLDSFSVGYFGAEGSLSHVASKEHFQDPSIHFTSYSTIPQVFSAVVANQTDYGVVPIRNSLSGLFRVTHELLFTTDIKIVGEIKSQAKLHLVGACKDVSEVTVIYSHPDAITQCQKSLLKFCPTAKTVPVSSTSEGAAKAASEPGAAAIAHLDVLGFNGKLGMLQENIQDDPRLSTRFLILARNGDHIGPSGRDKTVLVFGVKDEPGALTKALGCFENINLSSIESNCISNGPSFLVELLGHVVDKPVVEALDRLKNYTTFVRIVGSFSIS
uniref:chorismate mutase n=1 Tax=Arcella intermedia TaxID=1963864 RepID=A0A6B2L1M6_9EUKA